VSPPPRTSLPNFMKIGIKVVPFESTLCFYFSTPSINNILIITVLGSEVRGVLGPSADVVQNFYVDKSVKRHLAGIHSSSPTYHSIPFSSELPRTYHSS